MRAGECRVSACVRGWVCGCRGTRGAQRTDELAVLHDGEGGDVLLGHLQHGVKGGGVGGHRQHLPRRPP